MYNFMKKQYELEKEDMKKKEKKDQTDARQSLTPEELQRLEEARRSINQKFATDEDRSQSFDASDPRTGQSYKTTYKVTLKKNRAPPTVPPKSGKGGGTFERSVTFDRGDYENAGSNLGDHVSKLNGVGGNELIVKTSQIPSVRDAIRAFEHSGGISEETVLQRRKKNSVRFGSFRSSISSSSSFDGCERYSQENLPNVDRALEFSLQESPPQTERHYDSVCLQLPAIIQMSCRSTLKELLIQRRPSGDFGFTLRKGTAPNRRIVDGKEPIKTVIFAEPGEGNTNSGLTPGDILIEVNGTNVEGRSRDEVIELIRKAGTSVKLKVEPSEELIKISVKSSSAALSSDTDGLTGNDHAESDTSVFRQNQGKTEDPGTVDVKGLAAEKVWLKHKSGFALGQLVKPGSTDLEGAGDVTEGKCRVRLDHGGEILDVDEEYVEKANPPTFDLTEDLTLLRHMNESSVLHVLHQRYASDLIHTNAGPSTLVVVNPMHSSSTYTDKKVIQTFKDCRQPEDTPPHIYAVAQSALRNLVTTRQDQSVVLIGRSGSGKTTNARHILNYYAITAGSAHAAVTAEKLDASFTVLDAFGNSRTITNTSTSNFIQISSANFDSAGHLTSVSIQAVMLERDRLVHRLEGEPTFHVFYQMLAGIDLNLRKELHLDDLSEHCMFMTPLQRAEECQQAVTSWAAIDKALTTLSVTEHEKKAVYSILAAIYHLGVAGVIKGPNGNFMFAKPMHGQHAADVLGTSVDELLRVIFSRSSSELAHRPTVTISEKSSGSINATDDLERFAVDLYSEGFQQLVALINRALSSSVRSTASVFVTDSPGFRNPTSCNQNAGASLEDLFHNYLQERLQLLYHETLVSSEQDLYSRENIDCDSEVTAGKQSLFPIVNLIDGASQSVSSRVASSGQTKGLLQLMEEAACVGLPEEQFLETLSANKFLTKGAAPNSFVLQHLQGTNPVQYNVKQWFRTFRDSFVARQPASQILQQSKKSDVRNLFGSASVGRIGVAGDSFIPSNGHSRAGTVFRALSPRTTTGVKLRGLSLQIKNQTDAIIDLLQKTHTHFVHCFLPQPDAGLCELRRTTLSDAAGVGDVIDVPLLRSQFRGAVILPVIRLHRQGFPEHLLLQEFVRRYESLVSPNDRPAEIPPDFKQRVDQLMQLIDCDKSLYRIGETQVFLRSGGLRRLNERRDRLVTDWIVRLQAACRGSLARQKLRKLKLQNLAASCVQRNVRKLMAVSEWPWWRLYTKVKPLLDVHRTETELRDSQLELEQLKAKLEKVEREKSDHKQTAERLEAKLSSVVADLQEENASSVQVAEMLESERLLRLRLEKDLKESQTKLSAVQQQLQTTAVELNDANVLLASVGNYADENDNDDNDNEYRERLTRVRRDAELSKKKMEQQHAEDVELLQDAKRQLERRLAEARAVNDELSQKVQSSKRKSERVNQEMSDLKLHLEEQCSRNLELEKKQKRFDNDLQKVKDISQTEKVSREKVQHEKDELAAQRYVLEKELKEVKSDFEMERQKVVRLEKELQELASSEKCDQEIMKLKQLKIKLESKITEQEEELDEQAGSIQQLEQAKLKLEMAQERVHQQHLKELEERELDAENMRNSMQKKLKSLEIDVEEALQEKQKLVQEKRNLERQMRLLAEQTTVRNNDAERSLRVTLRKTKALLRDAQLTVERQKDGNKSRASVKQLRNQLDDAEYALSVAAKAKKAAEMETQDLRQQLEDMTKAKNEIDQRYHQILHSNTKLQTQLEENDEEIAELMKKYKASIQQNAVERITFNDKSSQFETLVQENARLKEELNSAQNKVDFLHSSTTDREAVVRLEAKISDLETRLEFEQTTKNRTETQVTRLKEQLEKETEEKQNWNTNRSRTDETNRRLERRVRELEEELNDSKRREADVNQRRTDLEKRLESIEADFERSQTDLQLAFKRIADLHSVIENDMEHSGVDSDLSSCEDDNDFDSEDE